MKRTETLQIAVTFDDEQTDAESLASALDILLETSLSTPEIMSDYGPVEFAAFYVAPPPQ
jgi:hypothetical protein